MRFLRFFDKDNLGAFLTVAAALHSVGMLDDSRGIVSGIDEDGPWMALADSAVPSAVNAVARSAGADSVVVNYSDRPGSDPATIALSALLGD